MIRENLKLPFTTSKDVYDPNTYTKVRLMSNYAWNHMDWDKGRVNSKK